MSKSHLNLRAQPDWPPAVVAGAFQTGVLGVRSLQRRGVKAVCFDFNRSMQGFRSVYGKARLCPNPDEQPERWLEFMMGLGDELGRRAVLIPSSDAFVSAIARYQGELEAYYRLCPGIGLQGQLAQKQTQYRLAMEHGMPMPETRMIGSEEELIDFCDNAQFPILLKPWHFREWEQFPQGHPLSYQKVSVTENLQVLIEQYRLAKEVNTSVVVQEVIIGPDTSKRVYLACYDAEGKRIANALFKELRCVPMGFGPASVSQPVEDEEADRVCNEFLQKIGYSGICEIEVKRDSRDGKIKLIEANPRLSGGGDAAPYADVDLCWIHYLDLIGEKFDYAAPSKRHFKHIVFSAEGVAIPTYMKAGLLTWKGLFESYKPPLAFFDLDWRDWKNSLETLYKFFRLLINNLFTRK